MPDSKKPGIRLHKRSIYIDKCTVKTCVQLEKAKELFQTLHNICSISINKIQLLTKKKREKASFELYKLPLMSQSLVTLLLTEGVKL